MLASLVESEAFSRLGKLSEPEYLETSGEKILVTMNQYGLPLCLCFPKSSENDKHKF